MPDPCFYAAIAPEARFRNELDEIRCFTREIGRLVVPAGRLTVCDPLVALDEPPLAQHVPAGRYPVVLAIARYDAQGEPDERVAAAMVRFSEAPPVTWEMAVHDGSNPSEVAEGEIFGYGVDAGIGSFGSELAVAKLMELCEEDESYVDSIIAAMETNYVHTRDWTMIEVDPATGLNVAAFSSGFGDGFYASYWGRDAAGDLACLVTDFDVVGQQP